MWEFLIKTNLLNFCIFAAILLIFQQKFLTSSWKAKNKALNEELQEAVARQTDAEEKLSKAQKEFQDFQNSLSNIETENQRIAKELKESLAEDNKNKIQALEAKFEREILRIKENNKRMYIKHVKT